MGLQFFLIYIYPVHIMSSVHKIQKDAKNIFLFMNWKKKKLKYDFIINILTEIQVKSSFYSLTLLAFSKANSLMNSWEIQLQLWGENVVETIDHISQKWLNYLFHLQKKVFHNDWPLMHKPAIVLTSALNYKHLWLFTWLFL